MAKIELLNLYAGLGGNAKKLDRSKYNITAVEINPKIAKFYQDNYHQDTVIVDDAHEYLLKHYKEYDFIWSSINCPTHSRARFWASKGGKYNPEYPDMKLYEEIIFLEHFFDGGYVVENVKPYYKPLIKPTIEMDRHIFWSNFTITPYQVESNYVFSGDDMKKVSQMLDIDISGYSFGVRKDKLIRNCVNPNLGLHILNCFEKAEAGEEKINYGLFAQASIK